MHTKLFRRDLALPDPAIYEWGNAQTRSGTPALLLDLDRMEHNLNKMADFFSVGPTRLRPDFKENDGTSVCNWQSGRSAGAIGMTCATPDEAEAVIGAGIPACLIADQLRRLTSWIRSWSCRSGRN